MKLKKLDMRGFSHDIAAVLVVVIVAILGVGYLVASHADDLQKASFFISPSSNAQITDVGSTFTVTVEMDTNGDDISSASPLITYPANLLQCLSATPSVQSSNPNLAAAGDINTASCSNGTIKITDYTDEGNIVAGYTDFNNVVLGTVTFKALAPGAATLNFVPWVYGSQSPYSSLYSVPSGTYQPIQTGGTYTISPPAPLAPALLSGKAISSSEITLQWPASSGADGYYVYRGGSKVATTTSQTYFDTGLAPGIYSYYVVAYNGTGSTTQQSQPSATIQVSTLPPPAPTGLTATVVSNSQVNLAWKASTGATGYSIYINGKQTTTTSGTTYKSTGLTVNTTYSYYVIAYNNVGLKGQQSGPSNTATAKPEPLASGEKLSIAPAARPAQYTNLCELKTSAPYVKYVTQGSAKCWDGGSLTGNANPGNTYNVACVSTTGTTIRYDYVQVSESCPVNTKSVN